METSQERLRTCDAALRLAVAVIQIEQARRPSARLGYTQINYGRLFIRDRWTLFSIARELGCQVSEILSAPDDKRSSGDAPRWSELVSAAESILSVVNARPAHVRMILVHRAGGKSWRQIEALLPGRVMFSIQEDYEAATLLFAREDVETLTSHDDRRLKKTMRGRTRGVVAKIMLSNTPIAC
jgi:hypothetical protein